MDVNNLREFWNDKKVVDLKQELKDRTLDNVGRKVELIDRLIAYPTKQERIDYNLGESESSPQETVKDFENALKKLSLKELQNTLKRRGEEIGEGDDKETLIKQIIANPIKVEILRYNLPRPKGKEVIRARSRSKSDGDEGKKKKDKKEEKEKQRGLEEEEQKSKEEEQKSKYEKEINTYGLSIMYITPIPILGFVSVLTDKEVKYLTNKFRAKLSFSIVNGEKGAHTSQGEKVMDIFSKLKEFPKLKIKDLEYNIYGFDAITTRMHPIIIANKLANKVARRINVEDVTGSRGINTMGPRGIFTFNTEGEELDGILTPNVMFISFEI